MGQSRTLRREAAASAIAALAPPRKPSVIVPVYNEKAHVEDVLRRARAVALPNGMTREITVVDDGSTDGTVEILDFGGLSLEGRSPQGTAGGVGSTPRSPRAVKD